ncbi:helix-turn-helix transcriptional regulator [Dietzia sp.]|uniref:helix-turn-helix transcriptional regulator n=1 Tax=Dietzia sp. TaxID=1871616 RepID=UPI002FD8D39B
MGDSVSTTERLLSLLDLLGRRTMWTGTELAEELGTTERTVRRDVDRLRSLGYRVEAAQGVGGGYRLGPGRRLPPLLLNDDEAVRLAVALRGAIGHTSPGAAEAGVPDSALGALTKLEQHMPSRLREQVAAIVRSTVALDDSRLSTTDPDALLFYSRAIRDARRLRFDYVTSRGRSTSRTVLPHRLVSAQGHWYLQAFDLDRDDWRSFRVDRISGEETLTAAFVPRQDVPPPEAAVGATRPADTWEVPVSVLVDAPIDAVRQFSTSPYVELAVDPDDENRTLFRTSGSDIDSIARHLAHLPWEFRILEPAELREGMARVAARLRRAAED